MNKRRGVGARCEYECAQKLVCLIGLGVEAVPPPKKVELLSLQPLTIENW